MALGHKLVCVRYDAWLTAAVMFLLIPLPWLSAIFIAAVIHEFSHILAIILCKGKIYEITITSHGAKIHASCLSDGWMLLCILAGPAGGLLLVFLYRFFPRLALCALMQSAFNLLPFYPLDGGRALRCTVSLVRQYFGK